MKKIILGLGALSAVIAPVAVASECGGSSKAASTPTGTNANVNELDMETLLTSNPLAQAINKRLEKIAPGLTIVDPNLVIAAGGHSTSTVFDDVLQEMKSQFSANPIPGATLGTDPISIVKVSDTKADAKVLFVTSTGQKMVSKISILKSLEGKDLDAYATKFVRSFLGGSLELVDATLFNAQGVSIIAFFSGVIKNSGLTISNVNTAVVDATTKNITLTMSVVADNTKSTTVQFVLKSA